MFCQQFVLEEWRALFLSADPISLLEASTFVDGVRQPFLFPSPSSLLLTSLRCRILQSSPVSRDVYSGYLALSPTLQLRSFYFEAFISNSQLTIICTLHCFFSLFLEAHFSIRKSPNCPLAEVVSWTVLKRAEWLAFWLSLTFVTKAPAGSAWGRFAFRSDSAGRASVFSFLSEGAHSECFFSP